MKTTFTRARHRQAEKLALGGLRVALAIVFAGLGFGFLFLPWIADDQAGDGLGRVARLLLGVSHLAGGLALLVPRLARQTAIVLGLVVVGSAFYLRSGGVGIIDAGPVLLVAVLLLFLACLRLRERVAARAWDEILARYADQQDALRSENA